jgi:predicted DNA-binding protein (MmcQ/YjbR family)
MGIDVTWLRSVCGALPGTEEDIKWGGDLCFCVGGKMYAVTAAGVETAGVSLKTTPLEFEALVQHESVEPAPYLARYHWIAVQDHSLLDREELARLLVESHRLVVSKFTKKRQRELLG